MDAATVANKVRFEPFKGRDQVWPPWFKPPRQGRSRSQGSAGPVEASAKVGVEVSAITGVNPGTSGAVAARGTGYKIDS